ncbi:MAG: hypothetical protein QOE70_970 [Chthoniobacter sp.]|jgi:hypothetical protein|nr:hypothetical protein [Chthoniobacter sp.]
MLSSHKRDWGACWASEVDRLVHDIRIPLRLQRQLFLLNPILGDYDETGVR